MTNKYKDFDALLLDLVCAGVSNFTALYCHPRVHGAVFEFVGQVLAARDPLALLAGGAPRKARQLVGNRLQALRRAGKIVYSGGRWRVCQ